MSLRTRVKKLEGKLSPEDPLKEGWGYARLLRDVGIIPIDADLELVARACAAQGLSVRKMMEEIWAKNDGLPPPPGAIMDEEEDGTQVLAPLQSLF